MGIFEIKERYFKKLKIKIKLLSEFQWIQFVHSETNHHAFIYEPPGIHHAFKTK